MVGNEGPGEGPDANLNVEASIVPNFDLNRISDFLNTKCKPGFASSYRCHSFKMDPLSLPPADGAGEGFRVADAGTGARGFLDNLATYLTQYSAGAGPLPANPPAGMRLPTLEEAIQSAPEPEPVETEAPDTQEPPPAQAPRHSARTANGAAATAEVPQPQPEAEKAPSKPTSKRKKRKPTSAAAAAAGISREQLQKKVAIEERSAAVDTVRSRLQADRTAAAQHLRTLRAVETPIVANRSFGQAPAVTRLHQAPALTAPTAPSTTAASLTAQTNAQSEGNRGRIEEKVAEGEVVVRLAVHLPQAPAHVGEEFLVLGSQNLTVLRDTLHCLCEANVAAVEREENERRAVTGAPPLSLAKPSAYFYLEGTFYVDNRVTGARDLSEGIREYLKQTGVVAPPHPGPGPAARPLGPLTTEFSVAKIEERVFEDVWVRMGPSAPGLYCHQGGCEHLVTVRDVRAHDPRVDPPLRGQYPFRVAFPEAALAQKRKCEACGVRLAAKVTHGDPCAPATPFFWCSDCFLQMHYDAEGRALFTNYKVFPYQADYAPLTAQERGR